MIRRALIVSAILLMVLTTEAAAVCQTSDLQGRWHYFAFVTVHDETGQVVFTVVANCRFTINSNGIITVASCPEGDAGGIFRQEYLNRQINIEPNCGFSMSAPFFFYLGQISIDKTTGSGIAGGGFDRVSFDLVKIK